MKTSVKQLIKPLIAVPALLIMLASCTTTIKVPKHPGPGEPPPPPPKVEIHKN